MLTSIWQQGYRYNSNMLSKSVVLSAKVGSFFHPIPMNYWLVVYLPLWKIWVRQLGLWNSQYMESHKKSYSKPPIRLSFPSPHGHLEGPSLFSQPFFGIHHVMVLVTQGSGVFFLLHTAIAGNIQSMNMWYLNINIYTYIYIYIYDNPKNNVGKLKILEYHPGNTVLFSWDFYIYTCQKTKKT